MSRGMISLEIRPILPPTYASPWQYRKSLSIYASASSLSNYAINVTVNFVSGKMKSDFTDIRFLDSYSNDLSFWRRSYTSSTTADFWVKIPSIPDAGTTIYMFYGNASASSASSISSTFPIFADDFETGSAAFLSAWTNSGSNVPASNGDSNNRVRWDAVSSYASVSGSAMRGTYTMQLQGNYGSVVSSAENAHTSKSYRTFSVPPGTYRLEFLQQGMTGSYSYDKLRVTFSNVTDSSTIQEWIFGAGQTTLGAGQNITLSAVTSYTSTFTLSATKTLKFEGVAHNGGWAGSLMLDDIFIRQYPASPPSLSSFGAEQTNT